MSDAAGAESAGVYRPHLDGLRAVAVYLVVLFHAGSERFPGGYIGVDVFFVLSGYLVTQLLSRDLARTDSIRFGRFYARRFRRLLPAAFVALIVTAVAYTAIAAPAEVTATVGSFKAAFLYSTNWYFIHQATGYFGADITANPVLHFWSLAVEEQFYLLWPLALGGGFALTRRMDHARRMRVLHTAVTVGAIASALWALSLRHSDPNRAYYGTDTRAYELLAGALIALAPAFVTTATRARTIMRIATTASVAALLIVASSWVHLDAIERGIAVTLITCVLIVALEASDRSAVKRILSTPTAVYLGKISYGTYLWHWLVILVVARAFQISSLSTIAIAALVATALAALSYELLEHPIRTNTLLNRHRAIVITTGLAISLISALIIIPTIVDPSSANAPSFRSTAPPLLTPVPEELDSRGAKMSFPACVSQFEGSCTVVRDGGRRILLIGDSNAAMLSPLFADIAHREGLGLSLGTRAGCPWQRDLYTKFRLNACRTQKDSLYGHGIERVGPDVIVVMNLAYGRPGPLIPPLLNAHGRRASLAEVERATKTSMSLLRAKGRKVLLIEPIPVPKDPSSSFNPFTCLYSAKDLEQCRYHTYESILPVEKLYRELARANPDIHSLNLDTAVCPLLPVCDPMIGGVIVRIGPTHLTTKFAQSLAPHVDDYMKRTHLIPG